MFEKYASLLSANASDYREIITGLEKKGFAGFQFLWTLVLMIERKI
jgi:hypothetical protein